MSDVDEVSPDVAEPGESVVETTVEPAMERPVLAETGLNAVGEPGVAGPEVATEASAEEDVAETAADDETVTDETAADETAGDETAGDETVDSAAETSSALDSEPEADELAKPLGDADGDDALGFEMPPAMSQMLFVDVVLVLPSTHPVVVLQEADFPYRELRIPIGGPEGIAIGYASRRVPTPRPLTHELMTQLMENFSLTLEVVRITGLSGGMFSAEMTVSGPEGQRDLDCRPSDGIALALRQQVRVPIMADPDVLDRAGGAAAGQN